MIKTKEFYYGFRFNVKGTIPTRKGEETDERRKDLIVELVLNTDECLDVVDRRHAKLSISPLSGGYGFAAWLNREQLMMLYDFASTLLDAMSDDDVKRSP